MICFESGDNFMLTVGVRERETRRVTSYGATSETNCPVNVEDITVYYHRVKKQNCSKQGENFNKRLLDNQRFQAWSTFWAKTSEKFSNYLYITNVTQITDRVNVFICQLEPLSLPPTAWQLQGQILSLFLSFLIFCLYVSLTIADHFYEPLAVVSSINLLQQSAQLVLTWLHSTDIAFCCPGISVTRWFIHQDFYTQVGGMAG